MDVAQSFDLHACRVDGGHESHAAEPTRSSLHKNEQHYDAKYAAVNVGCLVRTVRNLQNFLSDAILTDTSWHGLYQGGFAEQLRGKRVLELGCGDGLNALVMASLGAEVIANDISTESGRIIRQAASELGLKNIHAATGDFQHLRFEPRSFDWVVGKAFLHHLTHELEAAYLAKAATLLTDEGEARFFEPAVNSQFLDRLRWMVPVSGRPSSLSRRAFAAWKQSDPHPDRDDSSAHYRDFGRRYFQQVQTVPIGSIERFCRLMPKGKFNRAYRRWAHRTEVRLPMPFRELAARSQLIVYRRPIR